MNARLKSAVIGTGAISKEHLSFLARTHRAIEKLIADRLINALLLEVNRV